MLALGTGALNSIVYHSLPWSTTFKDLSTDVFSTIWSCASILSRRSVGGAGVPDKILHCVYCSHGRIQISRLVHWERRHGSSEMCFLT